jgi:hypothetical protein
MRRFLFSTYADNVAPIATVTASAEDPDYPVANLVDRNPGTPSKLTTTTGWWTLDFGVATVIEGVVLWKHTFDPGLEVRVQLNDTDSWTSPAIDTVIEIPALPGDGYPYNPFIDLTEIDDYATGWRYLRISVPTDNSRLLGIGDVFVSTALRELQYLQRPTKPAPKHPRVTHETDFLVPLRVSRGVRVRSYEADGFGEPADVAELLAWNDACHGGSRVGLFIPNPDVNDAWLVLLDEDALAPAEYEGYSTFHLGVDEFGAGLPL